MLKRFSTVGVLATTLCLLVLVSCSSKKKSTNNTGGKQPPTLAVPDIQTNVNFNSTDPTVQGYESMVEGLFTLATTYLNYGAAFLAPLANANWGDQVSDCWVYDYSAGGTCGYIYEVCETDDGYTWALKYNGNCGGIVYDNWVAYSGSTDDEGLSGQFAYYNLNTTDVLYAWQWGLAEDLKSGGWDIYDGEILEENRITSIDWMENLDASQDVIYEIPGDFPSKMTAHTNADGTAGNWVQYGWTGTEYYTSTEIIWNADGSGSYTLYNQAGTILDQDLWD